MYNRTEHVHDRTMCSQQLDPTGAAADWSVPYGHPNFVSCSFFWGVGAGLYEFQYL